GTLRTRWVKLLGYRQHLVGNVPVDPETIITVSPRSKDSTFGLDRVIRESLFSFVDEVAGKAWWGKEREAVSLFAFGHLLPHCTRGSALFDPGQIGIEVRVKQRPVS